MVIATVTKLKATSNLAVYLLKDKTVEAELDWTLELKEPETKDEEDQETVEEGNMEGLHAFYVWIKFPYRLGISETIEAMKNNTETTMIWVIEKEIDFGIPADAHHQLKVKQIKKGEPIMIPMIKKCIIKNCEPFAQARFTHATKYPINLGPSYGSSIENIYKGITLKFFEDDTLIPTIDQCNVYLEDGSFIGTVKSSYLNDQYGKLWIPLTLVEGAHVERTVKNSSGTNKTCQDKIEFKIYNSYTGETMDQLIIEDHMWRTPSFKVSEEKLTLLNVNQEKQTATFRVKNIPFQPNDVSKTYTYSVSYKLGDKTSDETTANRGLFSSFFG
eukprot:CAMPEP_0117423918 /NCGR_PEP_ID=MMETSP0758-20121206/4440_1 /TAXON_ID=63605 /ORGANISM="Percolomonas cosmopolitus, Strain AE-1 (ATCC 50343)" /LENGTH=329 /DNA_ID=CAMNT_0005207383 /DNA_START=376 /DNA_END=1365 /DNA_ORIENTATION=+